MLAIVSTGLLASITLPSFGKVVFDGPTARITWPTAQAIPYVCLLFFSLCCIFIGMWKRRAFEIVGWIILVVYLLAPFVIGSV